MCRNKSSTIARSGPLQKNFLSLKDEISPISYDSHECSFSQAEHFDGKRLSLNMPLHKPLVFPQSLDLPSVCAADSETSDDSDVSSAYDVSSATDSIGLEIRNEPASPPRRGLKRSKASNCLSSLTNNNVQEEDDDGGRALGCLGNTPPLSPRPVKRRSLDGCVWEFSWNDRAETFNRSVGSDEKTKFPRRKGVPSHSSSVPLRPPLPLGKIRRNTCISKNISRTPSAIWF